MPQKIGEILERLQEGKGFSFERTFHIDREAADPETRTVNVAFASDKPIDHWFGMLALSMDKKSMRSERLKNGAPLLMDHKARAWDSQVGVVENFAIGNDGVARANVRFSKSARGEEVFQDVRDGIRQCISVGFIVHEMHLEKQEKKGDLYRSDDWEPYEISIVSVPADISVGVGRSSQSQFQPLEFLHRQPEKKMENENGNQPESPALERRTAEAITARRERDIIEWAEIFGESGGEIARNMLAENAAATQEDVRIAIRATRGASGTSIPEPMAPREQARRDGGGIQLATSLPRYGTLRSFRGERSDERAYRFGQWLMGGPLGVGRSRDFCAANGIPLTRAHGETVNEKGGFLVPDEFGNDLIDLREEFGVFRRIAKMAPMASDTRSDPRRTTGLTAYFVAEQAAITESEKGWDRVELVAKKLGVLARYSSEVSEDAMINFADDLAGEIAYAFANKEDDCGFNGDGLSSFGGIVGAREKLKGLSATIADIAGLQVGAGNAYSELLLTDFEAVVARLPQYADSDMAVWVVHRTFYWNVMVRLMLAVGGVTAAEVQDGRSQRFMGYRVEFSQVMPKTEANSQVCALLGDFSKGASFGTRRDTTIAQSEHSRFANDELEIRGTERFDINVHSVGNASATPALREAGPIVGLITAAA